MHGKTTTSAMTAHVLRESGLHPSHYIGAEIPILGTNAHWDTRGEYFVAEGDESDGTSRVFAPEHALILNIEEEHLDFYADLERDREGILHHWLSTLAVSVFYSADDANASRLCTARTRCISYGFSDTADYRGADIESERLRLGFLRLSARRKSWAKRFLTYPAVTMCTTRSA